ncbi:cupredoxin domain-containing protein [Metabacillus niabensis]|uniref:cupredoxin domain-containing protein n=1 Tax=Metabacillus niabensis TaxID=324854 RepID=UPI001CFA8F58|nr:cupredoxin domain-containing protein [Metabacillus niabensis]
MRFVFIRKKWIFFVVAAILMGSLYFLTSKTVPTSQSTQASNEEITINMVTGEFSTTTAEGKKLEAYRWDPGTVMIPKGKDVTLKIFGVNGEEHPFYIEGTDIKGTVKKGEETVIPLNFTKEGTYRLICDTHTHVGHNEVPPMIAYLVVD